MTIYLIIGFIISIVSIPFMIFKKYEIIETSKYLKKEEMDDFILIFVYY